MLQKNALPFLSLLIISLLCTHRAHAQDATRIALRIDGLTCDERDALNRAFAQTGQAHIAFACVPAGVVILEPALGVDAERSADSLRLHALPTLLRTVAPGRIAEDHMTQEQAEELCAQARR